METDETKKWFRRDNEEGEERKGDRNFTTGNYWRLWARCCRPCWRSAWPSRLQHRAIDPINNRRNDERENSGEVKADNERRRGASALLRFSAVCGEGGQEEEILDDNLYPVSIGFARDICSIAIHGLGAGLFTPLALVYVGQISDPRSRSVLLRLIDVAVAFATSNRQPPPHAYLHWRIIVRVSLATLLERAPRGRWTDRGNGSTFEDGNRGWTGCSPIELLLFVVQIFFLYSSWIELGHASSWNRSRSIRRLADNEIREEDFDLQLWKHRAFSIRIVALRLTLVMLEGYLFGSSVSWILSGESFSGELRSFGIGLVLGLWYIVWHWNRWPGSRYREFI